MAQTAEQTGRWRGFVAGGLVAVLLGSLFNLGVWGLARLFGLTLDIPQGGGATMAEPLGAVHVVVATAATAVVATLAFAIIALGARRRAPEAFLGLSLVVLLLSFIPVFTVPLATPATRVVLAVMLVVAFVFVTGPLVGRVRPAPAR